MKQESISFLHQSLSRQSRASLVAEGIGDPGFYYFVILSSLTCGFHLIFQHGCFSCHHHVCVPACGKLERNVGKDMLLLCKCMAPSLIVHHFFNILLPRIWSDGHTYLQRKQGIVVFSKGVLCSAKSCIILVKGENSDWGRRSSFCHS